MAQFPTALVSRSEINRAAEWLDGCHSLIDGAPCQGTHRLRVSVGLFHLCLEHQMGIHILASNGIIGSASALLRPQAEAYLRGMWFHRCATDKQVSGFLAHETKPPNIPSLIAALQKLDGFQDGMLGRMSGEAWYHLDDFTHGGALQVKARNTRNEIASNYLLDHATGVLKSSAALGLLAAVGIASAVDSQGLANDLLSLYRRVYGEEL